uniref:Uncharacterized protein n=1 Tax=Chromera velia CCMP2878 TaxID=1169474 RepID=A0A0G4HC88_9ALVE|eukprot:Cvel_6234.t1-p1 / transcript=Cvel_6234.t1 / gene=Cvel_6234 / organism=Chromera_velia_CCMP2878 / gene_product=hypothetical protein / transcript_product=hypothetical protein / location=Cvel_scaffold301:94722-94982(-) / protein_length=87 / sequence_SO=supercontig / SO=protein_coding / is_pseudo=false
MEGIVYQEGLMVGIVSEDTGFEEEIRVLKAKGIPSFMVAKEGGCGLAKVGVPSTIMDEVMGGDVHRRGVLLREMHSRGQRRKLKQSA